MAEPWASGRGGFGVDVRPDGRAVGGDLKERAVCAVGNERVAVRLAFGAADVGAVEVGRGIICVGPVKTRRAKGGTGRARVIAVSVHGRDDLVHGGIAASAITIVEDEDVTGAGAVGGNPDTAMLLPEHLVGLRAEFVLLGVAPAVEQVATFTVASTGMAGGLGGGGAVINDPDFAVAAATDQDLVKLRVVVNPVEMVPELLVLSARGIGIDEADVAADDTVVVLGRIVILDEVVPGHAIPRRCCRRRAWWVGLQ